MVIQLVEPVGFAANCYLVSADGKHAVAVDPGEARVLAEAQKRGLTVTHVLLTHGHFDHIGGCAALQAAGVKIGCPKDELIQVQYANEGARLFGMPPVSLFTPDFTYEGGDTLELDGITFQVIATPGHTQGSVCLLAGNVIFSGDTLFRAAWEGPISRAATSARSKKASRRSTPSRATIRCIPATGKRRRSPLSASTTG